MTLYEDSSAAPLSVNERGARSRLGSLAAVGGGTRHERSITSPRSAQGGFNCPKEQLHSAQCHSSRLRVTLWICQCSSMARPEH